MKQNSYKSLIKSGFFQVYFVAISAYCIANLIWVGIWISGFIISFLWTVNVSKVKAATRSERIVYSASAATGSIMGVITMEILKLLK